MRTPAPAGARDARDEAAAQLVAFGRELFGGGLRWLATGLTVAGVILLIGIHAGILPVETYWPVRTGGRTAALLAVFAVVFWSVIAVINWRSHAKRRRRT